MPAMMRAIEITAHSMEHILTNIKPDSARARFAHSCLTSTYNGERWYYITDNFPDLLLVDFTKMVITQDTLRDQYEFELPDENIWFLVTER